MRDAKALRLIVRSRRLVLLTVGILVAGAVGVAGGAVSPSTRTTARCFGAASRDPQHRCVNPHLRYVVRPAPRVAQITPNAPCTRGPRSGLVHPCLFGVPASAATRTIALIGDSHASHWRAALETVARAEHWRGVSITNGVCPISKAVKRLTGSKLRSCLRWNRDVPLWLERHPEVSVIFQSQITSNQGVYVRTGHSEFDTEVSGYIRRWHALPSSVKHIVVIRDTPKSRTATPSCVMRARAARRPPGLACALSRRLVLRPDPAAVATARTRSRRVQLADMTHFFCGRLRCFPVVGGALVPKDVTHITRVFSTTLGPFLLRRVEALMAGWSS